MEENKAKQKCSECGEEFEELDEHHIVAKKDGGTDEKKNKVKLCKDCHYLKHHKVKEVNFEETKEAWKRAIEENIFSEGYGILPRKVMLDKDLCAGAKLLYTEVSSLCAERGYCWASNKYLANKFNVNTATISQWLTQLEKYLFYENRTSNKRKIYAHILTNKPLAFSNSKSNLQENLKVNLQENLKVNLQENLIHNNINNNNIKSNKNPPKAEYQKNSENKQKPEIQSNSDSKIAMSSVEKNSPIIKAKKLGTEGIEFFKVYKETFRFTCSERTKAVVEGVPRVIKLYKKYYGKNYLEKFRQSVDNIASDKYWRKVFSDNPLRVAPKNFFNQTFVENNLIGRVNKINTKQNGEVYKTVLSEKRRKEIDAENDRQLEKLARINNG